MTARIMIKSFNNFQDLRAVIFDLDGLLINSESLWGEADRIVLAKFGIDYHDELHEVMRGRGQRECAQLYIKHFNLNDRVDSLVNKRIKTMRPLLQKKVKLMPGAKDLIVRLSKAGFVLALATGGHRKEMAEEILEKFFLKNFFNVVISGFDVKRGKPFPDIFLACAQKLGVLVKDCLVLEDAENGVEAAKAAGMKVIAVNSDPKVRQKFKGADLVVESLEKVGLDTIKNLN